MKRFLVIGSLRKKRASIVAHNGIVKAMMAERPADMWVTPYAEKRCHPVILRSAAKKRGLNCPRGIDSGSPFILAIMSTPIPPKTKQNVLKVQGVISVRAIFIAGQVDPQTKVTADRRIKPVLGNFS
jgi:hypothetical protein